MAKNKFQNGVLTLDLTKKKNQKTAVMMLNSPVCKKEQIGSGVLTALLGRTIIITENGMELKYLCYKVDFARNVLNFKPHNPLDKYFEVKID